MRTLVAVGCAASIMLGSSVSFAADMPVKAQRFIGSPEWLNLFAGVTAVPDAIYGEAGAVAAINGNINSDGWLVRIKGGGGNYEYNRAPGLRQRVDFQTGDFMIGYHKYFGGGSLLSIYGGANVENHDNNDPLATVAGTKWGGKILAELYTPFNPSVYGLLIGSYSTAFNNYYTAAKLGIRVTPAIAIGPEIAQLGNDRFDSLQTGGFVAFNFAKSAQFIVAAGYQHDERSDALNDHSGAYGTVHLRGNF